MIAIAIYLIGAAATYAEMAFFAAGHMQIFPDREQQHLQTCVSLLWPLILVAAISGSVCVMAIYGTWFMRGIQHD